MVSAQVIDVHREMETMVSWFPSKVKKIYPAPKDVNLTKIAKALAKEAPQTCGKKHKERLSYVTGQLEKLASLLQIMPGIIGPKFPAVAITTTEFISEQSLNK